MIDLYSLFKFLIFNYSGLFAFLTYLHSISHNLSLLSRHLNRYRRLLNYVLQAFVNKSVNMVKQLYYNEIHSKNIEIYLSKLYTGKYSEINDVIKYTLKTVLQLTAGVLLNEVYMDTI